MSKIYNITKPIGILGIGSFGTVLANLIATERHSVIMYARKQSTVDNINVHKKHRDIEILPNVNATTDLGYVARQCDVIFPVLPSYAFRPVIKELSNFLTFNHILIHGAKGFDVKVDYSKRAEEIRPQEISAP